MVGISFAQGLVNKLENRRLVNGRQLCAVEITHGAGLFFQTKEGVNEF